MRMENKTAELAGFETYHKKAAILASLLIPIITN